MDVEPIQVENYVSPQGRAFFEEWLLNLEDWKAKKSVLTRIARLREGNLGDCKFFDSILELRIDYGPGYRLYCGKKENRIVILLVGGTKKTQARDIETAKRFWTEYQWRGFPRKRPL